MGERLKSFEWRIAFENLKETKKKCEVKVVLKKRL